MHKFGEWTELSKSTCTEKGIMERTCECGFTEEKSISLLPHNALTASCTEASFCKDCGALTGPQLGHSVVEATCTTPAYCGECNAQLGSVAGHKATHATCTMESVCSVCGERLADPTGHYFWEATCINPQKCLWCGESEGDALGHKWLAATCTEPKTCARCQVTEGMPNGHAWNNFGTKCLVCGVERDLLSLGVYMTGDIENSHTSILPYTPNMEARTWVTSEGMVGVDPLNGSSVNLLWMVDKDVRFDIEEYPIAFILTKNLCTCGVEGKCFALESCNLNLMAGPLSVAMENNKVTEIDMAYDPIIRDGDMFLYFYHDYSKNNPNNQQGKINGVQFTVNGLVTDDPDSMFDICFVAFFKTLQDAKLYMGEYLDRLYPVENATIGKDIVYTETDLQTEDAEDTEIEIETEVETLG